MRRPVGAYGVGPGHRLTVPGLLRQLHDTAQAHAASCGFGYRDLFAEGLAWALVCLDLGFRESAPVGEATLLVETAVNRSAGPIVLRDYRVTSSECDRVLTSGQSMWVLIDLDTRCSRKPSPTLRGVLSDIATTELNDRRASRLRPDQRAALTARVRHVGLHDCDFNGHLNNVTAAQWMLDDLYDYFHANGALDSRPQPMTRGLAPKRLRLSYHREALFGQRIRGSVSVRGDTFYTELRNEASEPVATAVINF